VKPSTQHPITWSYLKVSVGIVQDCPSCNNSVSKSLTGVGPVADNLDIILYAPGISHYFFSSQLSTPDKGTRDGNVKYEVVVDENRYWNQKIKIVQIHYKAGWPSSKGWALAVMTYERLGALVLALVSFVLMAFQNWRKKTNFLHWVVGILPWHNDDGSMGAFCSRIKANGPIWYICSNVYQQIPNPNLTKCFHLHNAIVISRFKISRFITSTCI
jgi:hypothetical protein